MTEPFRIFAQVQSDQLGLLADPVGSFDGPIDAKHKWNSQFRRYCIPNEMICAELGRFIGLPIPPYAVTYPDGHPEIKEMFSSLKFTFGGREDRPVIGENVVQHLPKLAAGILVFDVFVVNADRHDENLMVDKMDVPRKIRVYDHDQALLGGGSTPTEGIERLRKSRGRLGITGSEGTGGNRHVLIDHFTMNKEFLDWCNRIYGIPTGFIKRICKAGRDCGLTSDEAEEAAEFLARRRRDLRGILNRHKAEFSSISAWETL